jgi:phage-related protein
MIEMFELLGELVIDMTKAYRDMEQIQRLGEETANTLQQRFTEAFKRIENLSLSPDINTDDIIRELDSVQALLDQLYADMRASGQIDINTDPAALEINELLNEISRLRERLRVTGDIQLDTEAAMQELALLQERARSIQTILSDARYTIDVNTRPAEAAILSLLRYVRQLDAALQSLQNRIINVTTNQTVNENIQSNTQATPETVTDSEPATNGAMAAGAAGTLSALAGAGAAAASSLSRFAYDVNRVNRQLEAMQRQMLRIMEQFNPYTVLQRVRERLDVSRGAMQFLPQAQNMMQLNAVFSMIEQGAIAARQELARIGFGRTKTELKAIEAQMHTMANMRLDNLRDQIKLTEKALKEMKASANVDELADEIKKAEEALALYKKQLEEANPVQQIARANGYAAAKIFGKDVLYKPINDQLERIGARISGFFNQDLAYLANKAYTTIDNAAKAIIGSQTTKMEERLKIQQLAMRYQMLGQQINTFVTPAVLGLAAAFALVGKNAEEGWNKFQAQTLSSDRDMKDFKNLITDTAVATGATTQEVGELFSVLYNQMGRTKANIKESAEIGLFFKKVWGVDAVQAIAAVDAISQQLGVNQKQAADILALALKEYQGDLKAATKDVLAHKEMWKDATKAGTEGAKAYEKMVHGIDNGAIAAFARAFRQIGAAALELWKQLEPTLKVVANRIYEVAQAMTEFFREHPHVAKLLAHFVALSGAGLVLLGVFAPLASFMIRFRGLLQGVAQAMGAAARGGTVVLAPAVRMIFDMITLTRNAIIGLPRVLAGIFPTLLTMLRALPGAMASFVVQFIKMNPLLSVFAALAWVAYKNWDRFGPVLKEIWTQLKRIGNAIIEAFAGPGKSGIEGFSVILNKIAKIAGDILLPLLKALVPVLEVIATAMENGGGKVVAFGAALWLLGGALGRLVPVIGGVGGKLNAFFGIFKKTGAVFGVFKKVGTFIAGLGGKITRIIGLFRSIITIVRTAAVAMTGPVGLIIAAISLIGIAIYKNWDKIKNFFSKIKNFFKNADLKTIGKSLADGLWQGLKAGLAFVSLPLLLIKYLINPFKKLFGINSPSRLFYQFGVWIIQGLANGLKAAIGIVRSVISSIGSAIRSGFRAALSAARSIVSGLGNAVSRAFRSMGQAVRSAVHSVTRAVSQGFRAARNTAINLVRGMTQSASRLFSSMRQAFSSSIRAIRNAVASGFRVARNTAINLVRGMAQSASRLLSSMRQAFSSSIRTIRNAVTNGFRTIRNTVSQMMNAAGRVVSSVLNSIRTRFSRALSSIRSYVSNTFRNIVSYVRSGINGAYRFVSSGLSRIGSVFSRFAKRAFSWGSDIVRGIVRGIRSAASAAYDAISTVAENISRFFRRKLGINSPATVLAADAYWAPMGVAKGIREGIPEVEKASGEMAEAVRSKKISSPAINPLDVLTSMMSMSIPLSVQPVAVGNISMPIAENQNSGFTNRDMILTNPLFQIQVKQLMTAEDLKKMLNMVRQEVQNIATDDFDAYARRQM